MRVISQAQALDFLRRQKAPIEVRRALGDYQDDPNVGVRTNDVYDESQVFTATKGNDPSFNAQLIIQNNISFGLYPFVIGAQSSQILPQNTKRKMLLVQNQSLASNLFLNFSSDASVNNGLKLTPGQGVLFDVVTPNNPINVYYDSNTNQPGMVIEGSPQS